MQSARYIILLCVCLCSLPASAGIGLNERLVLLSERIASSPSDPDLYLRRALIYSDTGEFKLAFADLDTASGFGPVENTYFVRGILFYRLGQFDQALPLFDAFIDANPRNPDALIYRARVLRDAGQTKAALADYLAYFALNPQAGPGDYVTAAHLMTVMAERGDAGRSHQDVLEFLDARIRELGAAPQLQRYAIELEQQACRSEQVIERLNQLYPNARRAPQWHLQAAEQYLLLDQKDRTDKALETARALLSQRRPTAIKAELSHRAAFLHAVLEQRVMSTDTFDAVLRRFYPDGLPAGHAGAAQVAHVHSSASGRPAHSHEHSQEHSHATSDSHTHRPDAEPHTHAHDSASIGGFEQPQAGTAAYQPEWAGPVAMFVRCYRSAVSAAP